MKYNENKNCHIFNIRMSIIHMFKQCCKKLPLSNFEWIKDTSQFNQDFIRNYNEESDQGFFLVVDVQYLGKLHDLHDDLYHFYLKG